MPRERSDMRRIREVLRLRDEFGASVRRIAAACRMPRTTVRDYLRRLESAELRFGDVREWSDAELERRLFPPPTAPSRPLPDWAAVERDLGRRGVTLHLLWQEYLVCQPDGYRYTQFGSGTGRPPGRFPGCGATICRATPWRSITPA